MKSTSITTPFSIKTPLIIGLTAASLVAISLLILSRGTPERISSGPFGDREIPGPFGPEERP